MGIRRPLDRPSLLPVQRIKEVLRPVGRRPEVPDLAPPHEARLLDRRQHLDRLHHVAVDALAPGRSVTLFDRQTCTRAKAGELPQDGA